MNTIDNIMVLADSYAAVSAVSTMAHAVEVRAELVTALTELASTATEYQQAADKMAMEHKVERDWLKAEVERLKTAAKYAEHIDATPANQRETMLHDLITERNELRQQLAKAQALIEAIRKQEAVAWAYTHDNGRVDYFDCIDPVEHARIEGSYKTKLYAAPVVAPDVLKDADRYRWLREYLPSDDINFDDALVAALNPEELDAVIDAAMGGTND